ncbi:MAG TPA: TauD/TfdA family dioxygenase [Gammaproteobacteria bacterium]|nr:TauD/TfdA family dioxygenase [Gammaproteobacteria bacterium]
MANKRSFTLSPLSPAVGARITAIDLRKEVDESTADALRHAFAQHSVLCFPNQQIDSEDQIRFAAIFGRVDVKAGSPVAGGPGTHTKAEKRGVMFISNLRSEGKPIGDLPDGELQFHSDGSHRPDPYRATTLFALKVTSVGGETKFANLAAAYDALPDDVKARIDNLTARHVYDKRATKREQTNEQDDSLSSAVHPLVRIHPETGRKSLYVSRLMTRNVIGMDRKESDDLLEMLCTHAERPEFVYAHRWSVGDLLIWDNRAVNHARNDFPPEQERHLRRITISDPGAPERLEAYA